VLISLDGYTIYIIRIMIDINDDPPWRDVLTARPDGTHWFLTLTCGHTVDAIHRDTAVRCLACCDPHDFLVNHNPLNP